MKINSNEEKSYKFIIVIKNKTILAKTVFIRLSGNVF